MRFQSCVQSRHLMDWVESKSIRFGDPEFAEELIRGKALEDLEPSGEVVGQDEVVQVSLHLVVAVVVITADGGILDGSIHALDLAVGPG